MCVYLKILMFSPVNKADIFSSTLANPGSSVCNILINYYNIVFLFSWRLFWLFGLVLDVRVYLCPYVSIKIFERKPARQTDRQTARTNLGELHELLGGRHHNLWLHLIAEAVGDVGVAVIEQLADDQLVQLLTVLQRWFLAIHVEQTGRRTLTTALWETDEDSTLTSMIAYLSRKRQWK